jgi:hypothetical protein
MLNYASRHTERTYTAYTILSDQLPTPATLPMEKKSLVPTGLQAGSGPRTGLDVTPKRSEHAPAGSRILVVQLAT